MKVNFCPICKSEAILRNKEQIGYQNSKSYEIYHCSHCHVAYANPLKVDEQIYNSIYAKAQDVPGYARYYTYAKDVLTSESPLDYLAEAEDVYWGIREFLKKSKKKPLKILEVGCGFGYLTFALVKAGHKVKGIDISKVAIEQASRRYGDFFECVDLMQLVKREKNSYELIIFTEVIEHIENVGEFMGAVDELLKPHGSAILTTPNRSPYPEDVLWETEPPPVHLYWFSENTISYLAKKLGHRADFIDFAEFNYYEYSKRGDYCKPEISIRNYMPSRLPRLDESGDVLKELPNTLHKEWAKLPVGFTLEASKEVAEVPKNLSLQIVKKIIKKMTKLLGVYPLIKRLIDKKRSKEQKKNEAARILSLFPKSRPTMCAILTKPGKFSRWFV